MNRQGLGTILENLQPEAPHANGRHVSNRYSPPVPYEPPIADRAARKDTGLTMNGHPLPAKLEPRTDAALPRVSRSSVAVSKATDPEPNTDLAIAFLDTLDPYPDARWDLAAIDPVAGAIECATFLRRDREKMRRWIDMRQGKKNLYTSVNRARDDAPHNVRLNQKDHQHIGMIRAIVADIDPKKIKEGDPSGENFRNERARLLKEVAPALLNAQCPPTIIVDS